MFSINLKSGVLTTDSSWFIWLCWGTRRLSSRCKRVINPHQGTVGAHYKLWWAWFRRNRTWYLKTRYEYVVIDTDSEGAGRYLKELIAETTPRTALSEADQLELIERRKVARMNREFELADKLRKVLEEAGVVVMDEKL